MQYRERDINKNVKGCFLYSNPYIFVTISLCSDLSIASTVSMYNSMWCVFLYT